MSTRLTSIVKWGCIVYSVIFLPRLFMGDDGSGASGEPAPLRVGMLSDSNKLSPSQKSVLAELSQQGYTVDKLLVLDQVDEHMPRHDKPQQSLQLDQLLAEDTLDDIDVLLCQTDS